MILFELCGRTEDHPIYQAVAVANGNRQFNFLTTVVGASIAMKHLFLSDVIVKALNFHAIACLHPHAGEYRPGPVFVGLQEPGKPLVVTYTPPDHTEVPGLMGELLTYISSVWHQADALALATYVLWRLNYIHPFINGNGRTARCASYFILCAKAGHWLPGTTILPELLTLNRDAYVDALREVDASFVAGALDLAPLHTLLAALLFQQYQTVMPVKAGS